MKKIIVLIAVLFIQVDSVYADKSLRPKKSQDVSVTHDEFDNFYQHLSPLVIARNSDGEITKIRLFFLSTEEKEVTAGGIAVWHYSKSPHLFSRAKDKFGGEFEIAGQETSFDSCHAYGCSAMSYFGILLPVVYWDDKDGDVDFKVSSSTSSEIFTVPKIMVDNIKLLMKNVTHSTQPLPIPVPDELLAR